MLCRGKLGILNVPAPFNGDVNFEGSISLFIATLLLSLVAVLIKLDDLHSLLASLWTGQKAPFTLLPQKKSGVLMLI